MPRSFYLCFFLHQSVPGSRTQESDPCAAGGLDHRLRLSTHSAGALQRLFCSQRIGPKTLVVSVRVSVPALMSREVHFAAAGSSMPAALKGAPLKAVYYTYKTSTFQLIVRPEIAGPQNLKGKAIAVSSPGSSNDQAARLMLKKLGLEAGREVTLLSTGDSQARLLTMESNVAAGSAVNPDVAAHLALRGYRILMNSADVYPVPFSGMAAHEDLIRENPELIKR